MARPFRRFLPLAISKVALAGLLAPLGSLVSTVTKDVQTVGDQLQKDDTSVNRSAGILLKQATFLYGQPVAGGPYFPTGPLGLAKATADQASAALEQGPVFALTSVDAVDIVVDANQYNGLKTLDDYVALYKHELQNSLPDGPVLGSLTNYTQDLFFSMERLANSPYNVRRLYPSNDTLQFQVEDVVALQVANMTLQQLFQSGRLFYTDYRPHKDLVRTPRYAAACDAYFFIHPKSGHFLPLAIRTNVGSSLIYTPLDSPNEWLLAKIMHNVNDFFFAQTSHLASTHEVVQIAYMAAIRTLSSAHPVLGLLDRMTYQVFAIQPLAQLLLFLPGTVFDQVFPFTGLSSQNYSSDLYNYGNQGLFRSNYFQANLQLRGLINSTLGPELSSFPFYEDGSKIYASLRRFMKTFVSSYYKNDARVLADSEVQAWVKEARGPAKARDFPTISTVDDLVDVLTHMAHLVSFSHHAVNTNAIISLSGTLPFHPISLYKEPPTAKGDVDVASFLPPLEQVVVQFTTAGWFSRRLLAGTNRTLVHMFDDNTMLSRMNPDVRQAAGNFSNEMLAFSQVVKSRTFDSNGLSQGMPFLWKTLDPDVIPFSCSI
ncbi:Lipoxygenase [Thozetella sp. PMI_491]|nr:Lipoxygenase [Thozetella sp. PMI_491]